MALRYEDLGEIGKLGIGAKVAEQRPLLAQLASAGEAAFERRNVHTIEAAPHGVVVERADGCRELRLACQRHDFAAALGEVLGNGAGDPEGDFLAALIGLIPEGLGNPRPHDQGEHRHEDGGEPGSRDQESSAEMLRLGGHSADWSHNVR